MVILLIQKDINLNEDALLGDIMAELQQEPVAASAAPVAAPMIAPQVRIKKKSRSVNIFSEEKGNN